jgi:hypothetical protein
MDEYDVAVVVFCRTEGADRRDAASRAEAAVAQTMRDTGLVGPRQPGQLTRAVAVVPLEQAMASGYLSARPSPATGPCGCPCPPRS